ncbi:MAG: YafY family protein [Pseudohongiella sp.]|nr:YafY family protein [Pseudohongiella sp.]MDP2091437.1 YafY family protein [Pseudohongiella sp.]
MSKPVTRVLTLLELLQTHGLMSGPEIARRLLVDNRTVRRYISALEELGIPVVTEQGRYGGYKLVAGFKLPPMMFTDEETLAIALGLLAANQLGLAENAPAIASVQAKLERVMPGNLKRRVRAISNSASLILPKAHGSDNKEDLLRLTDAAHAQQRVRFSYQTESSEPQLREVDPYGIVFRRGHWYMVGHCHLRAALRTFRLDRLSNVIALSHSFLRPAEFDAAAHLNQSMQNMPRQYPVSLILHTDMTSASSYLHGLEGLLQQQDDGLLMNTSTDSVQWFARWLVQMPFQISILQPLSLWQAVDAHLRLVQQNVRFKA